MPQRQLLLNRRPSETFGFRWRGIDYTATTGRFPDGSLAEIFLSNGKMSTDSDAIARDGGVVASIALQFGAEVENDQCIFKLVDDGVTIFFSDSYRWSDPHVIVNRVEP